MTVKKDSLEELLVDGLKDIYDAEKQIAKALPKMAKAANSTDLKRSFEQHERQTQSQIERLDKVFKELNSGPGRKKCKGMQGLIEEGDEVLKDDMSTDVRDAGLIFAAQKVEHYEIASYGTVRTYAQTLGYEKVARLLQQTLEEESRTNEKLTALAESHINLEAA